jgi:anti-sigma-K factor RskA
MTSSEQNQGGRAQDEILAGEYVLGVLPAEARLKVEQRMARDRIFARIVKRWQADIAALKRDEVEGMPTQVQLRRRQRPAPGGTAPLRLTSLWNSTVFWRCLALGAAAIAVTALLPDMAPLPAPIQPAPRLAELATQGGPIALLASYRADDGHLRLAPLASGIADDHSLQLWLVASDGRQQSLGLLDRSSNGEIVVPADLRDRMTLGGKLMLSLEPSGGSPTGAPTGTAIASGPVPGM